MLQHRDINLLYLLKAHNQKYIAPQSQHTQIRQDGIASTYQLVLGNNHME